MDRVNKIRESLKKVDGILVSSAPNITYLTGISSFSPFEREAYVLITKKSQYIFTDGRYSEAVLKIAPSFKLIQISGQNPFKKILVDLVKKEKIKILGIEEDNLTVNEFKTFKKITKLKPAEIHTHRAIKEDFEINLIKRACQIADNSFKEVLKKIKPGVGEKEVAFFLEESIRKQGAYLSFPTIVAFGENSAVPHHKTSDKKLESKNGQFILMDFGALVDGYHSDMTRTIFFGKTTEKQKKIYRAVYEAQLLAFQTGCVSSKEKELKAAKLDKVARNYIVSKGYPSIPHSVGHGVGLEIHEHPYLSPKSKEDLKEGMIFSIEPGVYIPGFGGVRIEDLFLYTGEKLEQLTHSDKNLTEL